MAIFRGSRQRSQVVYLLWGWRANCVSSKRTLKKQSWTGEERRVRDPLTPASNGHCSAVIRCQRPCAIPRIAVL